MMRVGAKQRAPRSPPRYVKRASAVRAPLSGALASAIRADRADRSRADSRDSSRNTLDRHVIDRQAAPPLHTHARLGRLPRRREHRRARGAPPSGRPPRGRARAAPRAAAGARGFAAAATFAEVASALEQRYAAPLRYLHWLIAGGTLGAFATVQLAMQTKGKTKGDFMFAHKSLGLLVLGLTAPRLVLRFTSAMPAAVPGSFFEQTAASAGHALMYAFLVGMPATGFVMGYFGGKGLPFFTTVIPGAATSDGKLAGRASNCTSRWGTTTSSSSPRTSARWVCTRSRARTS